MKTEEEIFDNYCTAANITEFEKTTCADGIKKSKIFGMYVLHVRLREFGEEVKKALPRWIQRLLGLK